MARLSGSWYMLPLPRVLSYFHGKDIALVGNAESVLHKYHPIDEYEVVCRINAGSPKGKEVALGTRTDVLFTGNWSLRPEIINEMMPDLIVAYYSRGEELPPWLQLDPRVYQWQGVPDLKDRLGKNPSTGLAAFYIITRLTEFRSLTLYGFDWWKTKTWHTGIRWFDAHNPEGEKEFVFEVNKRDSRIRVHVEDDSGK